MHSVSRRVGWAVVVLVCAACGGDSTGPTGSSLQLISGDGQTAAVGQPLPEPLVVRVVTGSGNAVAGAGVSFIVTGGGGALSVTSAVTDTQGRASVTWTLGPAVGSGNNAATASVRGASGSPVRFTASAVEAVSVAGYAPDTLVQGATATITGEGFSPTAASNRVTIGGVQARVLSATATTLSVTVPPICRVLQPLPVTVSVGPVSSAAINAPVSPGAPVIVPQGHQIIVHNPAHLCVQLPASDTPEQYLVGVQSATDVPTSLTAVVVSGDVGQAVVTAPPAPAAEPAAGFTGMAAPPSPAARRLRAHRLAELALRQREQRLLPAPAALRQARASGVARSPLAVPGNLSPGDTVPIKIPDLHAANPCSSFVAIKTVVRAVGTWGVWLEDVANQPGYDVGTIQALSDEFDQRIYPVAATTFGAPTDFDENYHTVVVVTRQVYLMNPNLLGFVVSSDLAPTAVCPASNDGEVFYARAPDPSNAEGAGAYTAADARADAPFVIAHEFTHIIQVGRRIETNQSTPMAIWEAEGQATLAEEVVGDYHRGLSGPINLGFPVAFNLDGFSATDWYSDRFGDLAEYFGFRDSTRTVTGAPEQCGWLAPAPEAGPCVGLRQVYGVPWSFLRWISDHYAAKLGGEANFQHALIERYGQGFAQISGIVGVPIDSLLAPWAASLYTDDRYTGLDEELTFPSWNLYDIFNGTFGGYALYPTTRLNPRSRGFANFADTVTVRGGSSSYHLIGGTAHPRMAIGAASPSGQPLPATTRIWIVRVR